MKVFFTASPRGKKKDLNQNYQRIYELLEKLGCVHLSDFIKKVEPKEFSLSTEEERIENYKKTVKIIKEADLIVLETSLHSLATGYIANLALDLGKPVIALHAEKRKPYFLLGIQNEKLQVVEYSLSSLKDVLKNAVEYAGEKIDTRFNFFISPTIGNYLNWIAKHRKLPRAVYLRKLIEQDMEENKDYNK
ncbi:MAG: hypothetical protein NTZ93_04825 [Candidatus Beckwithbacteria bacterium]|nr:hypothetical protein [Candidatus Beckwithbacteria bacterium]